MTSKTENAEKLSHLISIVRKEHGLAVKYAAEHEFFKLAESSNRVEQAIDLIEEIVLKS